MGEKRMLCGRDPEAGGPGAVNRSAIESKEAALQSRQRPVFWEKPKHETNRKKREMREDAELAHLGWKSRGGLLGLPLSEGLFERWDVGRAPQISE
jgi:hypothetical protein